MHYQQLAPFLASDIDRPLAFLSLMHWHAIGTLEQATKDYDQAIQALATTLYVQCGCVKAKFHYAG